MCFASVLRDHLFCSYIRIFVKFNEGLVNFTCYLCFRVSMKTDCCKCFCSVVTSVKIFGCYLFGDYDIVEYAVYIEVFCMCSKLNFKTRRMFEGWILHDGNVESSCWCCFNFSKWCPYFAHNLHSGWFRGALRIWCHLVCYSGWILMRASLISLILMR